MPRSPRADWSVTPGAARRIRHQFAPGFGHALFAPVVTQLFEELRVSASIWNGASDGWGVIHTDLTGLSHFEYEHGKAIERGRYNTRTFTAVARSGKTQRGEFGGYSDFFVPILRDGSVAAVLVVGSFSLERPSSQGVLERWHWLTGRRGHMGDPEFAAYLSGALSTLVLPSALCDAFERFLGHAAALLSGAGAADPHVNAALELRRELEQARSVDHMWQAVRAMTDDRFQETWQSMGRFYELLGLGLSHVPDQALVGLSVSRAAGRDGVEEAIQRDALQRRAVELARAAGNVVAGQVGEQGLVFLCAGEGAAERKRRKLLELSERIEQLARRRYGLSLHFGLAGAARSRSLSRAYLSALAAAESALARGARLEVAEVEPRRSAHSLRRLRAELGRILEQPPESVIAKFESYLGAVAVVAHYRLDVARGHLDAGIERIAEPLLATQALEAKSFDSSCEALERRADAARTLGDLFAAYRAQVRELVDAVRDPTAARQERSLTRALDYVHQHYTERLRIDKVARLAGITPDYFSKLLKRRTSLSFEHYLRALRVERAKQLLSDTGIAVARVAETSGFNSPQYFSRAFHQLTGSTPRAFRRVNGPASKDAVRKLEARPGSSVRLASKVGKS